MGKYTKIDIQYLADTIRDRKDTHPERPFALLTGAGCSKSGGIPLASEFVKLINEEHEALCDRRLSKDECKDYGACMSALPTSERKALLDRFLSTAKVNWGHIAIASMMEAGFIGRVMTFNFDSILAKACGLLGFYPATYDFVTGATGEMNLISPRAIIHLHGQGNGIAMMNTGKQTRVHTKSLEPLFSHMLAEYPLLAIGYSGESDEAFPLLEQAYSGAQWFYWAGYEESSKPHVSTLLKKGERSSEFFGGADSDDFLMDLAKALGCWPPKLFRNAYDHLLDELDLVGKYPKSDHDLLEDLKSELVTLRDEKEQKPSGKLESLLNEDWENLDTLVGDDPEDPKDKEFLALSKFNEALKFHKDEDVNEEDLRNAARLYEEVIKLKPDDHVAFNNWGLVLKQLAVLEENPGQFQESFKKYKASLDINPEYQYAHDNWTSALLELYRITGDKKNLLEAHERCKSAYKLNPAHSYNFACVKVQLNDIEAAKKLLLECEVHNTLPNRKHLEEDADLDILRDEQWFKDLLERADNPDSK